MTRAEHGEASLMTNAVQKIGKAAYSRFRQRLERRYAELWPLLPRGAPDFASLQVAYERVCAQYPQALADPGVALRILRQWVVVQLMDLDCDEQAPLETVTSGMTHLAEFALDIACTHVLEELDQRHGVPTLPSGARAAFWVVGMGKLGARELNVSSDIDLIYVYDEDGETTGTPDGRGRISCREYFGRAVKMIYSLIGENTEHGFVFRVDLALRPNGNSGPSVVSLAALEEYLLVQGREWERFAWLKSRVVAPRDSLGSARALQQVVLPFVFRKYLDYNVFEALRTLHRQIRDHAFKRSAGHPERANDIKLSRGGIREIEFTVQLLQVVRGGQFPELRTRSTLDALRRLAKAGLMTSSTAQHLVAAYVFFRRVEHRIQYLDDLQTHVLPTRDDDLAWMAETLGFEDTCSFLKALDAHREVVAQEFDDLLGGMRKPTGCNGKSCDSQTSMNGHSEFESCITHFSAVVQARLQLWADDPKIHALREDSRGRLMRLLQRTALWYQEGRVNDTAILRMADWIEPLLRRESYLALLLERPAVHERLLRLLGAARWPARYLMQHPGVIDELAGGDVLTTRFQASDFESELNSRWESLKRTAEDDEENLLNLLRRAHHAELFRTLARDVEGVLSIEQVADDLSALADAVLRVSMQWCWSRFKARHVEVPQLAIIGYGKLGGKELGYGSDLDIVFVYQDVHEQAPEIYAGFVRKLIHWLTVKTHEGDLYEIDTALRPNGNAGLLVTPIEAYANYQQQRGSNTAWTWEHQAMTRARFVVGWPALQAPFDAVRRAVITAPRQAQDLKAEIVAMRDRVRQSHPDKPGRFDVKHSPGGMLDVEFVVQFLVLMHSAEQPRLADNVGNIALLLRAEGCGWLSPGMGEAAANAYKHLRALQHQARLNEQPGTLNDTDLQAERSAVLALWHYTLA